MDQPPLDPRATDEPLKTAPGRATQVRLGEELPVFCERCGYSLHGMPQTRCGQCQVLHFACPECGHHQPINTLRPAFQRILGRLRATSLVATVIFKIVFFGWLLSLWAAMGFGWSYAYNRQFVSMTQPGIQGESYVPQLLSPEMIIDFCAFAIPFGIVSRLLLLRWRRGWAVGLTLGALVGIAILIGAQLFKWSTSDTRHAPLSGSFLLLTAATVLVVLVGAMIAWPIWVAFARVFLPARASTALLEWQRVLSVRPDALARE